MAAGLTGRELAFLLGGAASGASLGVFGAHKVLKTKYQQFADDEIAVMKEHYALKTKMASTSKPDLGELVEDLGYVAPPTPPEMLASLETQHIPYHTNGGVTKNVFVESQPDEYEDVWDYKAEIDKRDPATPYIIHKDEYDESSADEEVDESTLTYFSGDEVLCDERDTPVDNIDMMVGLENLEHFGHGSGDANVLYIRNEALGIIFEINRSDGLFAQEVHGFNPEDLQHSAMKRRSRRGYDDE